MENYAIISEFNPFHKGHKYIIDKCRENGASHITVIMSGNFVQRGDVAVFSKYVRTRSALLSGADLVLELPLPYAMSNAQTFARGGVGIADGMGCVSKLAFGSEYGNTEALENIAKILTDENFNEIFKKEISMGVSYPKALANSMLKYRTDTSTVNIEVISSPNNVLGIEYIKALKEINSNIEPFAIKRNGDEHNSKYITSQFASATNIRELIYSQKAFADYVPMECIDLYGNEISKGNIARVDNNIRGLLFKIRTMSAEEIRKIADVSEGLENRIINSSNTAKSFLDFANTIKSKRYTHARIRRILLSCLLDLTKEYTMQSVPYIRILGFNERGKEVLSAMKKSARLPIVTKLTKLPNHLSIEAKKMLNLEVKSTDIYNLFTDEINPCNEEYTQGICIL